jgi:hypothetical protein
MVHIVQQQSRQTRGLGERVDDTYRTPLVTRLQVADVPEKV